MPEKAIKLGLQIVEGFQESSDSGSKLTAMQILGDLYLHQSMISDATSIIAAAQQECESRSPSIDLLKSDLMFTKTVLLLYEDKPAEAVATLESVQEQPRKEPGLEHELSLLATCRLGSLYSILGQPFEKGCPNRLKTSYGIRSRYLPKSTGISGDTCKFGA